MPYIHREDGKITAIFANQQYEGQEFLADDNEEILNFGKPDPKDLRIAELKKLLADSDYKIIRQFEQNTLTQEDFDALKALRQSYRDEINQLEGE